MYDPREIALRTAFRRSPQLPQSHQDEALKVALLININEDQRSYWKSRNLERNQLINTIFTLGSTRKGSAPNVRVGLYFHGGTKVEDNGWFSHPDSLKQQAAKGFYFDGGRPRLKDTFDLIHKKSTESGYDLVVLLGSRFDENPDHVAKSACALRAPVMALYQQTPYSHVSEEAGFKFLISKTGGALLPFGRKDHLMADIMTALIEHNRSGGTAGNTRNHPVLRRLIEINEIPRTGALPEQRMRTII